VECRQKRYQKDPEQYIKMLFDDARIDMILLDTGYPSEVFTGYSVDSGVFSKIVPSEIKTIFRIDNVVVDLVQKYSSLNDAIEKFQQIVDNAVKNNGAVGLKTVIAYITGLEVQRHPLNEVSSSYKNMAEKAKSAESWQSILTPSKEVKAVMDHFVFLTAEKSVELDVPLQIHVGMGDAPIIDLRIANLSGQG